MGPDLTAASTARSNRDHASDSSFPPVFFGFIKMAPPPRSSSKIEEARKREAKLAEALGLVCIRWGRLDNALCEFIELLAPLEPGQISETITAELDIRVKIQIIKALAFLRHPSSEWLKKMLLLLDYIDNDLRIRRNRYIHDGWYRKNNGFFRAQRKIKFIKPQSFQLELQTVTKTHSKITDVKNLAKELDDLTLIVFSFWLDYAHPENARSLPPKLWTQFLRRAKPSAHQKNERLMQQHPPQSSRRSKNQKRSPQ